MHNPIILNARLLTKAAGEEIGNRCKGHAKGCDLRRPLAIKDNPEGKIHEEHDNTSCPNQNDVSGKKSMTKHGLSRRSVVTILIPLYRNVNLNEGFFTCCFAPLFSLENTRIFCVKSMFFASFLKTKKASGQCRPPGVICTLP